MKLFGWFKDNILFVLTLFLLAFIPLYPKLPLVDIRNTWVYVRAEDFVVFFVYIVLAIFLVRKKITLKTPLTIPILLFWICGAVATIHGILIIFPELANVFPNIAFLSFIRHIEYLGLFFVAFAGIKNKNQIKAVVLFLALTLVGVVLYGFGQKYLGLPAFLTMNEEFAKGIPIRLSLLSRVPSTFAGHYDLAAYLVLILPLLTSMIFGFKNWIVKILLGLSVVGGFVLMFMTVSRVSFFVVLISLFIVLVLRKKKVVAFLVPIAAIVGIFLLVNQPALLERYGSTVKEVDVLVDAKTGASLGHVTMVPSSYVKDKVIWLTSTRNNNDLDLIKEDRESTASATSSASSTASSSASTILPFALVPPVIPLVVETNVSTGENLPQGTGYINLTMSPVVKRLGDFYFEKTRDSENDPEEIFIIRGDYIVKKASAYDLSYTTRFQGEWPHAIEAFRRNILFGSGYGSVSLAVDNNYLRMLGETGLVGLFSFLGIFIVFGIYTRKLYGNIDSEIVRCFLVGFIAGLVGLGLNAILIDVFEASKIAYLLWLLMGVSVGVLGLYQTSVIHMRKEFFKVLVSPIAIIVYLFILTSVLYSSMINNFFVGDDFTWLKWAAECQNNQCSMFSKIQNYFLNSDGFFYRPGTKTYFLTMYSVFWLNPAIYHIVSLLLHFVASVLLFFIARNIFRNSSLAALSAFLFVAISGYAESVFWIAATGHLFNAVFILGSLYLYIKWYEKRKSVYFIGALLSMGLSLSFHELGVVTPLLFIAYSIFRDESFSVKKILQKSHYGIIFLPVVFYLIMRFLAQSHWFGGDYNYNLVKLPFNFIGNGIGYFVLSLLGTLSLPLSTALREVSKVNIAAVIGILVLLLATLTFPLKFVIKKIKPDERRVLLFGLLFFIIALLPFLGLGNISARYSYLSTVGFVIIFVVLLERLYGYIKENGQSVSFGIVAVFISVFSMFHLIQLRQQHSDWYEASQKTKKFLTSIDGLYQDRWSKESIDFYFVDTPIRQGDAWIFPVGLKDSLWLAFRNNNLSVNTKLSLDEAISAASSAENAQVFQFNPDGTVTEVFQKQENTAVPSQ